jgi:hypothetical protein
LLCSVQRHAGKGQTGGGAAGASYQPENAADHPIGAVKAANATLFMSIVP